MCPWRGKVKGLTQTDGGSPTKKAGNLRKQQLVIMKGTMRYWTEKSWGFDKNWKGVPCEKGWRITNKATCVFEGEDVLFRRKVIRFLTTTDGGWPTEKAGKSRKKQLVIMKGIMCLCGGCPTKKAGKSRKKQLVFMKGNICLCGWYPTKKAGKWRKKQLVFMNGTMCFWTEKARFFWLKL